MSLPLNGFRQGGEMEPLSYSPEQWDRLEGAVEDWPDWSDPDESENRGGQSVQIHIQASHSVGPVSSRLAHQNTEEPWDDFEDTEPTLDLSPTAPSSDPVILTPPRGGSIAASVKPVPEAQKLGSSKPLKLTSTLRQSTQTKTQSSWDSSWAKEQGDSQKLHNTSNSKPTVPQKNGGTRGGLGEEFTIKVKKKVVQDPELDLFADMVPDIKLSSPALLSVEDNNVCDIELSSHSTENTTSLQVDFSIDTEKLTAKFAAVNLTEVSV